MSAVCSGVCLPVLSFLFCVYNLSTSKEVEPNRCSAWGELIFRRTDWHGNFNFFSYQEDTGVLSLCHLFNFTGENVFFFFQVITHSA